ncbi:MAG: transposase [Pirellulaceae bacterium]|nr:transposase [Pirellulaceae bacterium]
MNSWIEHFQPTWRLDIVSRPPGAKGFTLLPKRWVAERSFAWNGRCRRHSRDCERRTDSSESMIRVTAIGLMLRRLAPPDPPPKFNYRIAA